MSWIRRHSTWVSVIVLGLLAYVPALGAAPGRMPSDSKLYLYLNPGRFLADTPTTFDPRQFAGWVPHQHISYLWPAGPWFWLFEVLGVPDWIAHRLWIGTLLVAAGLGVRWMSRVVGLAPLAALVAALVYQLSPYVLPYISRTSVLLLPWAGLGWIVGCTALAARRGRWRYPAVIALIVLTVGSVNATALAMIIPAPALWLVHVAWRQDITWMRALTTGAKVALLSTLVSLWWIAMLVIQGRYGSDVLAYSESLESVSFTSTSTEVVRGLGYWLFYIRDSFAATTTASLDYLASIKIIAFGVVLLAVCLVGLVTTRWAHRRYAALLIGTGTILAVGVHPIDDPSPVMSVLLGDGEGGLALALRSSTRAVPVLVLGLALGAAMAVGALRGARLHVPLTRHRVRADAVLAAAVAILAVANLPALRTGGFVDPALERDPDPPSSWLDAATYLDELPEGYRVLQVPGTEFGAYRWGYTVDQPLPALTDRPLVTRDLLPLGSAAAMDLVFALDDRFQEGTLDVTSVAPVARLLGVDTVWVTGDVDFERFRLARPEIVDDLLTSPAAQDAGLLPPVRFGEPTTMQPSRPMVDEQSIGDGRVGSSIAPVTLVTVADAVPTVRVKTDEVVLSGDGAGIVDAAGAGIIDGAELIRYSASLGDGLVDAMRSANRLVVTDTNRDRAHHWRSSQDVTGFTESAGAGSDVLRFEGADQRLPVFDTTDEATQTVSVQSGPVTAAASSYGEPFAYLPEHRPVMAIDGDPSTSWTVADRAPAVGEFIVLDTDAGIDHVTLRQPDAGPDDRTITAIDLTIDDRSAQRVELDRTSLDGAGQRIDIEPTDGPTEVTISVAATSDPQPPLGDAVRGVGFAEIDVGLGPTTEFIRPPIDALSVTDEAPDTPISLLFTRLRTDPTDRWRDDPEPTMRRQFELARPVDVDVDTTLRLDHRAGGDVLAALLGENATDDGHLMGVPAARGAAALDGDTATSWITPFGEPTGRSLTLAGASTASSISVTQPEGDFSPVTELRLTDGDGTITVAIEPASTDVIQLPRAVSLDELRVEISAVELRTTVDRRFGEPIALPAAIAEIEFDGISPGVRPVDEVTAECRADLVELDGQPLPISFTATTDALLAGRPVEAVPCGPIDRLGAGDHELIATDSATTGLQVDQVRLTEGGPDERSELVTPVTVTESRRGRVVEVPPCPAGCWLVVGEGYNPAWSASTDDGSLGAPTLVDGNANGWYLGSSTSPTTVTVSWTAQRPVSLALALSGLGALLAIALAVLDRRRSDDADDATRPPMRATLGERPTRRAAVLTVAAGVVASALFIGWSWALVALILGLPAVILRRNRLLTAIGTALVLGASTVVIGVVRSERPYPGAGWPVRFEWLHGWTLLGVVLLTVSTLFATDARRRSR